MSRASLDCLALLYCLSITHTKSNTQNDTETQAQSCNISGDAFLRRSVFFRAEGDTLVRTKSNFLKSHTISCNNAAIIPTHAREKKIKKAASNTSSCSFTMEARPGFEPGIKALQAYLVSTFPLLNMVVSHCVIAFLLHEFYSKMCGGACFLCLYLQKRYSPP